MLNGWEDWGGIGFGDYGRIGDETGITGGGRFGVGLARRYIGIISTGAVHS